MATVSQLSKIDKMPQGTVMSPFGSVLYEDFIATLPARVIATDSQEFHVPGSSQ